MNTISLKEVPYNRTTENAINHCDVGGDKNFEIIVDDTYTIGHLYISFNDETANGIETPVYVNWLEFMTTFRSNHLLRPTLNAIYELFGKFYFESSEKNSKKYRKIGATSLGIDEWTQNEIFKFEKVA